MQSNTPWQDCPEAQMQSNTPWPDCPDAQTQSNTPWADFPDATIGFIRPCRPAAGFQIAIITRDFRSRERDGEDC